MAQQHDALLGGLGLTADQIAALNAVKPEEVANWKPDELVTAVATGFKNKYLNDQEFLNTIPEDKIPEGTRKKYESGQYARFQNELIEVATKQLGLDDKLLTEEDRKSIKTLAKKIATEYLGKNNSTDGLQKMQLENQSLSAKLEAKDVDWQKKLETDLAAVNTKAEVRLLKTLTRAELAGLPDVELNVPALYVVDPILAKLNAKFTLVVNDADEVVLMQKANPKLRAVDDKNKNLDFVTELKAVVLADKVGKEKSKQDDDGGGKKKVKVDGDGGATELPGYIQQKIDKNKK